MKRLREDFNKRKTELDEYFYFLSLLDKDVPVLQYSEKEISYSYNVKSELIKILKANGFLLIYNLVESFCRNFIIEILTAAHGKKLTLRKLSEEMRKIWIAQRVRNFKDPKTANEKLETCIGGITSDIFNNTIIEFSDIINGIEHDEKFDPFGLSGSIAKDKIWNLASQYGFAPATREPEMERLGRDLELVKTSRNKLAHGRITFAECGKDQSVINMIAYKEDAVKFLEYMLSNIETYLSQATFKQPRTKRSVQR